MTWTQYHRQALESIEETEREVDDTWDEAWLLLLLLSGRLRSRLAGRAARLDLADRRAVRAFRALSKRQADELIRESERGILGRSGPSNADPNAPTGSGGGGIQGRAIRRVYSETLDSWSAMRSTAAGDSADFVSGLIEDERRRRITVDPGADTRGPVETVGDLPAGERQLGEDAQAQAERMSHPRPRTVTDDLLEDRDDVEAEAALNPRRNIRHEAERLVETIVGITSRHGRIY